MDLLPSISLHKRYLLTCKSHKVPALHRYVVSLITLLNVAQRPYKKLIFGQ